MKKQKIAVLVFGLGIVLRTWVANAGEPAPIPPNPPPKPEVSACFNQPAIRLQSREMAQYDQVIQMALTKWGEFMKLPPSPASLQTVAARLETLKTPKRGFPHVVNYAKEMTAYAEKVSAASDCGEVLLLTTIRNIESSTLACHLLETMGMDEKFPDCEPNPNNEI